MTRPVAPSSVEVSTATYQFAHGRAPRGTGTWAFNQHGDYSTTQFFNGSYTAARRQAVAWAAHNGCSRVEVGS